MIMIYCAFIKRTLFYFHRPKTPISKHFCPLLLNLPLLVIVHTGLNNIFEKINTNNEKLN